MLCAGNVEEPLAMVRRVLDRLELTLNENKTRIVDARKESFNFLGFEIRVSKSWRTGRRYSHVAPAPKALAKIKESIKQKTDRRLTPIPLEDLVRNLNASLRGWVGYFYFRNSSRVLGKVKTYAEDRLRNHLMKRHKIRNRGEALQRFPREKLYADYGLYKVPMTARWKSAHASV